VSQDASARASAAVEAIYAEAAHWNINAGGETIHAKRVGGKWRLLKWLAAATWLVFFLGPYLRWDGRQAVLFDIPNRQFHLFGATVLPQDLWMLSLLLLFFAILLAVATTLAGRVWCGFFCFQTVWTDVFTWIEEKLEGPPQKRRKFDEEPISPRKVAIKATKHGIWLIIGFLTGYSFVSWFTDAPSFLSRFFSGEAAAAAYITVGLFSAGTYALAGFLREQACFWLCPYARIQGVMIDRTTLLPSYDGLRGEPRGRLKRGETEQNRTTGDCVDCKQCVAVCPTGVDIRHGQQEGCITCALCIDACDAVMVKLGRPAGLIRYASLDELEGKPTKALLKRPRVWIYFGILATAWAGIIYGLTSLDPIDLTVLHERQPLFVALSSGAIQNKYTLKLLNKTTADIGVQISASGPRDLEVVGAEKAVTARHGEVTSATVLVRVPLASVTQESQSITFFAEGVRSGGETVRSQRDSVFIGPRR